MTAKRTATIIATGSYVPERVVTNEELGKTVPTTDQWVRDNLGIHERRVAAAHEATSDLAAAAARQALGRAGIGPEDVDLIIVATATPDRLAPSTACIVQDKIGAYNAAAFDLAAVCSGFLYALTLARPLVESDQYRHVLVIGADTFSRITDWRRRDCVFFGDGAGAVVVSGGTEPGIIHSRIFADGRGREGFTVPGGGSETPAHAFGQEDTRAYFAMNTREVFEAATTVLPRAIERVLSESQLTLSDVDIIVPHQPGIRILQKTAEVLGVPVSKIAMNMSRYANTAGATIPLLLDEVHTAGRIRNGDLVLMAAVGSGWTWGALVMRWNAGAQPGNA
jgi:3-oxoacyl-[acyl-carrier-protein] synthase-3